MKRFVAVLTGLLALPAFADNVPARVEDGGHTDLVSRDFEATASATAAGRSSARASANRAGITRAVPTASETNASRRNLNAGAGRVVASTRAATTAAPAAGQKAAARANTAAGVISRSATVSERAPVARATTPRTSTPRVSAVPNVASRVRARAAATEEAVVTAVPAATTSTSVTGNMENIAALTSFCKAQYTECMDNFCNVLDDNQGRCSCSKNVKNYEKTEKALKSANEALQDVAQQIQYIGLSRDEIETLFSQTEAELQMQSTNDNSQLKNDLDKIKGLIIQVKSGTASSIEVDSGLSMDLSGMLDFNISSAGFDLSSMFGTAGANTNSISNQRGEQLYKTAAARCKTAVLRDCESQGVDISIVSNAYDMEIDKQCVAYERKLTDANDQMVSTVRNAKGVLQRARLMVAQQKNAYDLRGCINALDSCMQDDYVCGNDYENCLDPSGKYIVEGEVVVGSMPGQKVENGTTLDAPVYSTDGLYATWDYGNSPYEQNAWGANNKTGAAERGNGNLADYVDFTLGGVPKTIGSTMSEYLQYKMGYIENGKAYGMCSSVLNKCQDYTFENGSYKADNRVVEEYLMRTLVKIKNAQDSILADYAESCISDVTSCLSDNGYEETQATSSASKIAINACRAQVITCMSVNGDADAEPTPAGMTDWVKGIMNATSSSN